MKGIETQSREQSGRVTFSRLGGLLSRRPTDLAAAVSGYPALEQTISHIDKPHIAAVTTAVIDRTDSRRHQRQVLGTLNALVEPRTTNSLFQQTVARESGVHIRQVPELLIDPAALKVMDYLLDQPSEHHEPIARYLNYVPLGDLPEQTQDKVGASTEDERFSIRKESTLWELCAEAEERMETALQKGAVVVANDKFVTKFEGRLTALCTDTFVGDSGHVFVAGNWYSPFDAAVTTTLREAFDEGTPQVDVPVGGWVLTRGLRDNGNVPADELLEIAREYVANCPPALPDQMDGMSREQFRTANHEKYLNR